MKENIGWLVTCPSSDVNFKTHLKTASVQEVEAAIEIIKERPNTKTKLKALNAALKRKQKNKS